MRKKPPHEKETLNGFSGRVVAPPPPVDENADARPDSSDPLSSAQPANGFSQNAVDETGSLATGEECDGWTIERLKRRSSIPSALPVSNNPRENAFRISDTKTLKGLPRVSTPTSIPVIENQGGGAIDLVDRSQSSQIALDMKEEMEELYGLGEFTGALRIAELVLGARPDDKQAQMCAENSRLKLEQQYSSKIGPLSQVPMIDLSDADVRWLGLDHRAGFVLSRIDSQSSIEELVDICGMSRLELFKTLIELLNRGAIHFERR
jgi:hypothetical protein